MFPAKLHFRILAQHCAWAEEKKVEFLASSVVISNKSEWSTQKLLLLLTYYRVYFTYKKFREINLQYLPFVENVLCTDVSTYPNLSGLLLQLLPAP